MKNFIIQIEGSGLQGKDAAREVTRQLAKLADITTARLVHADGVENLLEGITGPEASEAELKVEAGK